MVILPGVEEEVAIVGITYRGEFFPFVPAAGKTGTGEVESSTVKWSVAPWGSWSVECKNSAYSTLIEGSIDESDESSSPSGTLRCPTEDKGMVPLCRDTFSGNLRVRLWKNSVEEGDASSIEGLDGITGTGELILDAQSSQAALEVGGGPWDTTWQSAADVKEPLKSIGAVPVDVNLLDSLLPEPLKIPGL